jgi:hypothetical protein
MSSHLVLLELIYNDYQYMSMIITLRISSTRRSRRLEEERKRREETRRREEAELRWREEQGKVQRLEQFVAVWRRNHELRQIATELRSALGQVEAGSELEQWLTWLDDHLESSDPMRHLRNGLGRKLTIYYHDWDRDWVTDSGFTESNGNGYRNEPARFGVELTCQPGSTSLYGGGALKLELSEEFLWPYEWAQPTDWLWREFRVPAALLNRELGIVLENHDGNSARYVYSEAAGQRRLILGARGCGRCPCCAKRPSCPARAGPPKAVSIHGAIVALHRSLRPRVIRAMRYLKRRGDFSKSVMQPYARSPLETTRLRSP